MGLIGAEDKYHLNGSFAIAQRWVHKLRVSICHLQLMQFTV